MRDTRQSFAAQAAACWPAATPRFFGFVFHLEEVAHLKQRADGGESVFLFAIVCLCCMQTGCVDSRNGDMTVDACAGLLARFKQQQSGRAAVVLQQYLQVCVCGVPLQ